MTSKRTRSTVSELNPAPPQAEGSESPPKRTKMTRSAKGKAPAPAVVEITTSEDERTPSSSSQKAAGGPARVKLEPGVDPTHDPDSDAPPFTPSKPLKGKVPQHLLDQAFDVLGDEQAESPLAKKLRDLLESHNIASPRATRSEPDAPLRTKSKEVALPVLKPPQPPNKRGAASTADNAEPAEPVLDPSYQAPCLKDQYAKLRNIPKFVAAEIAPRTRGLPASPPRFPSFTRWARSEPARLDEYKQYFAFVMNSEYTNPARAFPCPLVAHDVTEGQQYLSLRSSSTPARFITPVEVVKAVLLEPETLSSGWKRRLLLAVPFQQEESLVLANIGKALNVSSLVLSIWSEAFQFGTSLESANDPRHLVKGRQSRAFKTAAAFDTDVTLRLPPSAPVPIVDCTSGPFSPSTTYNQLKTLPQLESNPEPGSLGLAIYTIGIDNKNAVSFNIQAYVHLSDPLADGADDDDAEENDAENS